jgi:glucose/arabinose dehydrogenase
MTGLPGAGPQRRAFLGGLAGTVGAVGGCLDLDDLPGAGDEPANPATTVALETVGSGFGAPVDVAYRAGDDAPYVADQPGLIYRVADPGAGGDDGDESDADGSIGDPTVAADLRDRIVDFGDSYTERGLLGLTFHPEDDRAFVRYSAPPRAGTPDDWAHTFVLAELPVQDDGTLDVDGERTLLEIPEPQSNHNGGDLAFGPDGHLYVAVGDGGGAGDTGTGHVEDWYDGNPGGNGQDVTANLLGSILRIDIDTDPGNDADPDGDGDQDGDADRPYAIPDDNPLVDRAGLDEHYAWGLRNPWGMSFDPDTDRFVVADVGQSQYEEVNVVERGGNYGWNVREGRHCYDADDCPTETPDGDPLVDPVLEYGHDEGIAVVGGHVYRGDRVDALQGRYVFGDWQQRLFVADPTGDDWAKESLAVAGGFERYVLGFGTDPDGELLLLSDGNTNPAGDSGRLSRFVPADGDAGTTDGTDTDGEDDTDAGAGGDTDDDDGDSGTNAGTTTESTADGTPGFGALAAVLAGASALLSRYRRRR